MHLPTLSFYQVTYESDPPVLFSASQRPLSPVEITETCEVMVAKAQYHNCLYWLFDGRYHGRDQPQSLHDWMQEEYFPRVREVLGQPPCVAFLVAAPLWFSLADKGYTAPQDISTQSVHMGWFTEEAPARAWLARYRAHRAPPRYKTPYRSLPATR